MRFGIGQPVTRKEDPRFLTGRGRYVAFCGEDEKSEPGRVLKDRRLSRLLR